MIILPRITEAAFYEKIYRDTSLPASEPYCDLNKQIEEAA